MEDPDRLEAMSLVVAEAMSFGVRSCRDRQPTGRSYIAAAKRILADVAEAERDAARKRMSAWVKSRHMRCNKPCPLYTQ
jgi:hypothetical protein